MEEFSQATPEHVKLCYELLLKRQADSEEVIAHHLRSNPTLSQLVDIFVSSFEFQSRVLGAPTVQKLWEKPYVSNAFSARDRCESYFFTFNHLINTLSDNGVAELLTQGVSLFTLEISSVKYNIVVTQERQYPTEGEFSIILQANGVNLFMCGFNLAPGRVCEMPNSSVLVIARMQGYAGRSAEIREATKQLGGIHPQWMLLAAAEGIARAMAFENILCVPAVDQLCHTEGRSEQFERLYDAFFLSAGASIHGRFHRLSVPIKSKPLHEVKQGHRMRARRRQESRLRIMRSAREAWAAIMRVRPAALSDGSPAKPTKLSLGNRDAPPVQADTVRSLYEPLKTPPNPLFSQVAARAEHEERN